MPIDIIVHAGTEKTGSTSIQKALVNSSTELKKNGTLYPLCLGNGPHLPLTVCGLNFASKSPLFNALGVKTEQDLLDLQSRTISSINQELHGDNFKKIIFSDEHINLHLPNVDALSKYKGCVERFGKIEHVILYLRRQDRFIESMVSESIKNLAFKSYNYSNLIHSFHVTPYRFNYASIIANFEHVFGADALCVRGFNGSGEPFDVVADFARTCELQIPNTPSESRANLSLPERIIEPLVAIGAKAVEQNSQEVIQNWRHIVAQASASFPGQLFRLKRKDAQLFLERFREMNKNLSRRYSTLGKALVWDEDITGPDKDPIESVTVNVLIAEISGSLPAELAQALHLIGKPFIGCKEPYLVAFTNDQRASWAETRSKNVQSNIGKGEVVNSVNKFGDTRNRNDGSINADKSGLSSVAAICPICATRFTYDTNLSTRERTICSGCGASGRASAIVSHVCNLVYGNGQPLSEQPTRKDVRIVGLSDGPVYAKQFAVKFDYENTFYHQEPYLDIMSPTKKFFDTADILISSEVFEHVIGDCKRAFEGSYKVLKPGGSLLLTVPFQNSGDHKEHYDGAKGYRSLKDDQGKWVAEVEFDDGRVYLDREAKFHGGPGKTLEMRLFNRLRLEQYLHAAGFIDIIVHGENDPLRGIVWGPPSRPITARKPS